MKLRMQELLRLLTIVVERVRASTERAAIAESRAERMSAILDALSDENSALRADLDQAAQDAAEAQDLIRTLRDQIEAAERLAEALEMRAAAAELRIHRAADALGLPAPADQPVPADATLVPSAALH